MPKGGQNRLPTSIKKLRGTLRPGRQANEPQPDQGLPRAPSWLMPEARRQWRRLAPELGRMGVLTAVDGPAFALTCTAWAIAAESAIVLRDEGLLTIDDEHKAADGTPARRKHPAFQLLRDAATLFRAYGATFGLTPVDRGRLDVQQPEAEDELEAFLSGRAK